MNNIPVQHRISEAMRMAIDHHEGFPVVEIEFKFFRYRLIIDDKENGEKLQKMLVEILKDQKEMKGDEIQLPKFYKDDMKK